MVSVTETRSQTSQAVADELEERLKKLDADPFEEDEVLYDNMLTTKSTMQQSIAVKINNSSFIHFLYYTL